MINPRGPNKSFTYKDIYTDYKFMNSNTVVDEKLFLKVLSMYNTDAVNSILYTSQDYRLPDTMGEIGIRRSKSNRIRSGSAVNWFLTKQLWRRCPECEKNKQVVYHFNEHTDGEAVKWYWFKADANVRNKKIYTFRALRKNKRKMAELLQSGETDYFYSVKRRDK